MIWDYYQNLPSFIDPIAFHFGFIAVHWYSLMWLFGFFVVYKILLYRVRRRECVCSKEYLQDVIANAFFGAVIGGRLGYVIFYDPTYYAAHPFAIVSPYDFSSHEWTGIYGMSFHGGAIGVAFSVYYTAKKYSQDFLNTIDFVVPAIPLGYFFGRMGNFFNQELFGLPTTSPIGMYFNDEGILRHPSQLYEAFGEGVLLFIILWYMRKKTMRSGMMAALYVIGYGVIRGMIEFFREPDAHIGLLWGLVSRGQILSVSMIVCGLFLIMIIYKREIIGVFTRYQKM